MINENQPILQYWTDLDFFIYEDRIQLLYHFQHFWKICICIILIISNYADAGVYVLK